MNRRGMKLNCMNLQHQIDGVAAAVFRWQTENFCLIVYADNKILFCPNNDNRN